MTDETTAPATDNQPPADDAAEKTEFRSEAFVNRLLDEKKKTQLKNELGLDKPRGLSRSYSPVRVI